MTPGRTPYPDIGAAAWTVLLRADPDQNITTASAAALVGPDLAAEAVAQLAAKHLIADGELSPLAQTLRRWHRDRQGRS